jgi:hypothetical protein
MPPPPSLKLLAAPAPLLYVPAMPPAALAIKVPSVRLETCTRACPLHPAHARVPSFLQVKNIKTYYKEEDINKSVPFLPVLVAVVVGMLAATVVVVAKTS